MDLALVAVILGGPVGVAICGSLLAAKFKQRQSLRNDREWEVTRRDRDANELLYREDPAFAVEMGYEPQPERFIGCTFQNGSGGVSTLELLRAVNGTAQPQFRPGEFSVLPTLEFYGQQIQNSSDGLYVQNRYRAMQNATHNSGRLGALANIGIGAGLAGLLGGKPQ